MRLMGIFDWWLAVLEFISKSVENPTPATAAAAEGEGGAALAGGAREELYRNRSSGKTDSHCCVKS